MGGFPRTIWSPAQWETAQYLRKLGATYDEIGEALGFSREVVRGRFDRVRLNPGSPRRNAGLKVHGNAVVPPGVVDDRDQRAALTSARNDVRNDADITAAFFGDPLPGYSALDRKRGAHG